MAIHLVCRSHSIISFRFYQSRPRRHIGWAILSYENPSFTFSFVGLLRLCPLAKRQPASTQIKESSIIPNPQDFTRVGWIDEEFCDEKLRKLPSWWGGFNYKKKQYHQQPQKNTYARGSTVGIVVCVRRRSCTRALELLSGRLARPFSICQTINMPTTRSHDSSLIQQPSCHQFAV